jgi:hypothetical protein
VRGAAKKYWDLVIGAKGVSSTFTNHVTNNPSS